MDVCVKFAYWFTVLEVFEDRENTRYYSIKKYYNGCTHKGTKFLSRVNFHDIKSKLLQQEL